jgi:hypothetical protein
MSLSQTALIQRCGPDRARGRRDTTPPIEPVHPGGGRLPTQSVVHARARRTGRCPAGQANQMADSLQRPAGPSAHAVIR